MKVIGIAGFAKSGKDTFVGIASDILRANNYLPIRVAFADKLKSEVQDMLKQNGFGIDVMSLSAEEKERVRPLFVFWGCQRRYESPDGLYWVNKVDRKILNIINDGIQNRNTIDPREPVILVSDVRFPNEAKWIHDKWDGAVIHLKRWKTEYKKCGQDGSDECAIKVYDQAPNEEEAKQDPIVEDMADVEVEWENQKAATTADAIKNNKLKQIVFDTLNQTKYFKLPQPITGRLVL